MDRCPILGVFLPEAHCSQDGLQIHCDPDYDKEVTEKECMNEQMILPLSETFILMHAQRKEHDKTRLQFHLLCHELSSAVRQWNLIHQYSSKIVFFTMAC